ncbi:hypothetical protein KCP73_07485 [Salmonella enterica subsp. enterica]|nr:hypothetical protein KCP73_07485 [Salmonella enterica subsp. enterica]
MNMAARLCVGGCGGMSFRRFGTVTDRRPAGSAIFVPFQHKDGQRYGMRCR